MGIDPRTGRVGDPVSRPAGLPNSPVMLVKKFPACVAFVAPPNSPNMGPRIGMLDSDPRTGLPDPNAVGFPSRPVKSPKMAPNPDSPVNPPVVPVNKPINWLRIGTPPVKPVSSCINAIG